MFRSSLFSQQMSAPGLAVRTLPVRSASNQNANLAPKASTSHAPLVNDDDEKSTRLLQTGDECPFSTELLARLYAVGLGANDIRKTRSEMWSELTAAIPKEYAPSIWQFCNAFPEQPVFARWTAYQAEEDLPYKMQRYFKPFIIDVPPCNFEHRWISDSMKDAVLEWQIQTLRSDIAVLHPNSSNFMKTFSNVFATPPRVRRGAQSPGSLKTTSIPEKYNWIAMIFNTAKATSRGSHWVALLVQRTDKTVLVDYFDSFVGRQTMLSACLGI